VRKRRKKKKKPQLQNIMSASATQGGHNNDHKNKTIAKSVISFKCMTHINIITLSNSPTMGTCIGHNIVLLECGPMPNVMAALPNIGGALCSMPQSFADARY